MRVGGENPLRESALHSKRPVQVAPISFQRNRERRHRIPEDVLVRQIEQIEFPELDEGDRTLVVDENGNTIAIYGTCVRSSAIVST